MKKRLRLGAIVGDVLVDHAGNCSLMKKRLRLKLGSELALGLLMSRKLFADEEAIETT